MRLHQFQGLLDKVAQVECFPLGVIDPIANICVLGLVQIEHRQYLPIIWDEGLANRIRADHKSLEDLQRDSDNLWVACVQRRLDRDDQLGDHR